MGRKNSSRTICPWSRYHNTYAIGLFDETLDEMERLLEE